MSCWGVWLNERRAHVVKMSCEIKAGQPSRVKLITCKRFDVDPQAYWEERWANVLGEIADHIDGGLVTVAISDERVMYRRLTLPAKDDTQLIAMVQAQTEVIIPQENGEMRWAWRSDKSGEDASDHEVLVCGVRKTICDGIAAFLKHKASVVKVISESAAAGQVLCGEGGALLVQLHEGYGSLAKFSDRKLKDVAVINTDAGVLAGVGADGTASLDDAGLPWEISQKIDVLLAGEDATERVLVRDDAAKLKPSRDDVDLSGIALSGYDWSAVGAAVYGAGCSDLLLHQ